MIKKMIFIIVFSLILFELGLNAISFGLGFFGSNYDQSKEKVGGKKKIFKIMVLGESTSYGLFLKDRKREAFPFVIKEKMSKLFPDTTFEIINLSYPGQISDSIYSQLEFSLKRYNPSLVICQFGTNDSNPALNPFLQVKFFNMLVPVFLKKIKIVKLAMLSYFYLKYKNSVSLGGDGHFIFYNKEFENKNGTEEYYVESKKNYQEIINLINKYEKPYLMLSYFNAHDITYKLLLDVKIANNAHYLDLKLPVDENNQFFFADDGWHPSIEGHKYIAGKTVEYILNHRDHFSLEAN